MSTKKEQKFLYDQLLFGANRYMSPVLEELFRAQYLYQSRNEVIFDDESNEDDFDDDEDFAGLNDYQIGQFDVPNNNNVTNNKLPFL